MKGQGKKTAINYVANLLGYDILNIYLNESTKFEDIIGSIAFENENNEFKMLNIKTDFIKTLENKKYTIIIFHNINKANLSIIELITNFYTKKRDIFNINLRRIEPQYSYNFFISIFNYENSIRGTDYLPPSLVQNSIYFQMENNSIEYINKIITKKFHNFKFYEENEKFCKSFLSIYKFDKEELKESNDAILSLNEIDKFIKLRVETFKKLDIDIILGFIFIFRYSSNKIQEKIKNILKFGNTNSSLKFFYDSENINIEISMNKKYYYISLPLEQNSYNEEKKLKINIEEINKNIVSLTSPQRYCLLFLVCSYLSNKPCILQGETSSGKTHLIRLFAKMLGKKLNIYQMNNDSNIIMINGQSKFEDLNIGEINRLRDLAKQLKDLILSLDREDEISVEGIKQLLEKTDEYIKKDKNEEKTKKIIDIKKQIIKIISPINRFKYHKSTFCESLEKGEWVLIEQIESTPTEILERLIPLTFDNPEIKIIQGTKEILYKLKNNNKNYNNINNIINDNEDNIKYINPNFRIFFTYNPDKSDIKINQNLLTNCLTFTLPQNDSPIEYSTQMSYGLLRKSNFDKIYSLELSKRFSNVHQFVKQSVKKTPEYFSGKMQFTGRTINFISNYLIKNLSQISDFNKENIGFICTEILKTFYWNSFNEIKELHNFRYETISKFKENLKIEVISEEEDIKNNYIELSNIIEKINFYLNNIESNDLFFSFELFIKSCEKIKIKDINSILNRLNEIIDLAKKREESIPKNNYFMIMRIQIIINLLKDIGNKVYHPKLFNKELNSIYDLEIFNKIGKIIFLSKIVEKGMFNFPYISPFCNNTNNQKCLKNLLNLIDNFVNQEEGSYIIFKKIIEHLNKNTILFKIINVIFPYYKVQNNNKKKLSILWLQLFEKLYEKKIGFRVEFLFKGEVQSKNIFNENDKSLFPIFKFDTKYEDLFLASGICINQYDSRGKKSDKELVFKFKESKYKEKISLIFYESIIKILNQNINRPTSLFYKEIYESIWGIKSINSHLNQYINNIYYSKKSYNLNLFYDVNENNNKNLDILSNIFGIIFSLPKELKVFIIQYLNNDFIKKLYEIINKKIFELTPNDFDDNKIINEYQKLTEEIKKLSIFFIFIEEKNIYSKNENDLNISNKLKNDIRILKKIAIIFPEIKEFLSKYFEDLNHEYELIEAKIDNKKSDILFNEKDNIRKISIEEKIKELLKKYKDLKIYNNIISILRLIQIKLQNENKITKEYLYNIENIINKLVEKINSKEKSSEIIFPNIKKLKNKNGIKEINGNYIDLLNESLILYSYKLNLT